jgi:hypothetical protein
MNQEQFIEEKIAEWVRLNPHVPFSQKIQFLGSAIKEAYERGRNVGALEERRKFEMSDRDEDWNGPM